MDCQEGTSLRVIDSHTSGEPTRLVIEGVPSLGNGDMVSRRERLAADADWIRTSLILEPRGAPWMVGAVLQEPVDPTCAAGVIFFNNTGYLGMCGHGMIGMVTTLAHLDCIKPGSLRFETPAGIVSAQLNSDGSVTIDNVVSYRTQHNVPIEIPGIGPVVGDVAYGGNWFFLTSVPKVEMALIHSHTEQAMRIMEALDNQGIRGDDGSLIDHIELVGPPSNSQAAHARNFVLCPGGHYDRSPCGTGTSAKVACLAADNKLSPGEVWVQESITKTTYEASYREVDGGVKPTIKGQAFVTADVSIRIDSQDPLRHGFKTS